MKWEPEKQLSNINLTESVETSLTVVCRFDVIAWLYIMTARKPYRRPLWAGITWSRWISTPGPLKNPPSFVIYSPSIFAISRSSSYSHSLWNGRNKNYIYQVGFMHKNYLIHKHKRKACNVMCMHTWMSQWNHVILVTHVNQQGI